MNSPAYVNEYTNLDKAFELLSRIGSLRHPTSSCYPSVNETTALATLAAVTDPRWRTHQLGVFLVPVVGMDATLTYPNDSYPFEVIRVVSAITIDVREMSAKLDPSCMGKLGPGCNDAQKWIITSNPAGRVMRLRFNNRGVWAAGHIPFTIGNARRFNDFDI